jgi:small subunit ribosomal protein S2
MPYVSERWLGGMLTNFSTISTRVKKMQEYETMLRAGDFEAMPKREALRHTRELEKLRRNLGGIRNLDRLPNAIFVIDTKKEHIAVTEATKLGMSIVAVVDTNCDPDIVTHVIPGNDDAIRSGTLMCRVMAEAVTEGRWVAEQRAKLPAPTPQPAAPAAVSSPTPALAAEAEPAADAVAEPAPAPTVEVDTEPAVEAVAVEAVAVAEVPPVEVEDEVAVEPVVEAAAAAEAPAGVVEDEVPVVEEAEGSPSETVGEA